MATTETPRVELLNFLFTPDVVVVLSGQPVQLELITEGLPHTFTIRDLGIDITVPQGTTTQIVEFEVDEGVSREFQLVCRFHEVLGMTGTLRVE